MYQHFFKRLTFTLLFISSLIFTLPVQAEIKTYEGYGEYYITDNEKTMENAKLEAKKLAQLDAVEQATVHVENYSTVHNSKLTKDEIITITAGLIYHKSDKCLIEPDFDGVIIIKYFLTVEIDTDEIPEYVDREIKKRKHKK